MKNMVIVADAKIRAFFATVAYKLKNQEVGAVDIVAIIILIAVAVAVAVIFRTQLTNLVQTIMEKVRGQAESAVDG